MTGRSGRGRRPTSHARAPVRTAVKAQRETAMVEAALVRPLRARVDYAASDEEAVRRIDGR